MNGHEAFEEFVGRLRHPMYVVTVAHGGERDGCLVGFAAQVSIDPSRFLACLSRNNRTFRIAMDASVLAVHLIGSDQPELAELFGGETGDEVDKLAQVEWREGPEGVPVLADAPAWFAGRIRELFDLGDHIGFLLEPIAGESRREGPLYTSDRAMRIEPGHQA